MRINLTEEDVKEAIKHWLDHCHRVSGEVEVYSWSNDTGCCYSVETDPDRFLHKED